MAASEVLSPGNPTAEEPNEFELITPELNEAGGYAWNPDRLLPGTDLSLLQRGLENQLPPVGEAWLREASENDDSPGATPAQQLAAQEARRQWSEGLEKIIGRDDRRRVGSSAYPFSAICYLACQFPHGKYFGTGCLIAPDVVLTVAHNLYSRKYRNRVTSIAVYRGANGSRVNSNSGKNVWYHPSYRRASDGSKRRYDYAVIKLSSPYSSGGYLGVASYNDSHFASRQNYHIVGYAKDKPPYTMWSHHKESVSAGRSLLHYSIDTIEGNSGSPIIDAVPRSGGDTDHLVVGVHSGWNGSRNVGVRITQEVWNNIKRWL